MSRRGSRAFRRLQAMDDDQSLREAWTEFRTASLAGKLATIGTVVLFVPLLALVFLIGFFLFGGWALFDDQLPDWAERLLTFLVIVLVAWTWLKPILDRWEKEADRR